MAVELKKFQAELKTIDSAVTSAYGEWKMIGDTQGNFKKLLDGARLEIGDCVGKLKANGAQGTTLADFAGDASVKQALATATTALSNYKRLETRKSAALDQFKKVHKDLTGLADRMDAEIAERKKKLFEPKSLPEMIKVAKSVRLTVDEVGGLKSQSITDIIKTKVTPGDFEKTFWEDVEREVKKSASIRANAAVSELLEKFKPRLMKLRGDKVATLAQETIKLCVDASASHKKGQARLAKNQMDSALAKAEEMHVIVDDYSQAYDKNKSFLKDNPDHDALFKFVSGLTSKENQVLKAVQATQAVVK
jgi:hypothetical protein